MEMPTDPFAELQAEAVGMMREMAHAAWVIVTRADALYNDSDPRMGELVCLQELLPPDLHAAYDHLRFHLAGSVDLLSALDGWASGIVPLDQVEGYSKDYLTDPD